MKSKLEPFIATDLDNVLALTDEFFRDQMMIDALRSPAVSGDLLSTSIVVNIPPNTRLIEIYSEIYQLTNRPILISTKRSPVSNEFTEAWLDKYVTPYFPYKLVNVGIYNPKFESFNEEISVMIDDRPTEIILCAKYISLGIVYLKHSLTADITSAKKVTELFDNVAVTDKDNIVKKLLLSFVSKYNLKR